MTQVESLGKFASCGFTLEYNDDHVVELRHQGEFTARFSQMGATEQSIESECAVHLVTKHNADGR